MRRVCLIRTLKRKVQLMNDSLDPRNSTSVVPRSSGLYSGSVIRRFVIDRVALGIGDENLCAEYEALFGVVLSSEDLEGIKASGNFVEELASRKEELLEFVTSSSFVSRLCALDAEIQSVREEARNSKDLKTYVKLVDSSLKSLDLFMKTVKSFERREAPETVIIQQNNFYVLEELARDGLIELKDPSKLKRLFDIEDVNQNKEDAKAFV